MARIGVGFAAVQDAAEAVRNAGQEPTVDRVREHLGTGSKSTIGPLLKQWRALQTEQADISALPTVLINSVTSLHQQIQSLADQKIDRNNAELMTERERFEKKLGELQGKNNDLAQHAETLEAEIERIRAQRNDLQDTSSQLRLSLAKCEEQRNESLVRNAELKEYVAELKQEVTQTRDNLEHFQQRTADDRQQEREHFQQTRQQLENTQRILNQDLLEAQRSSTAAASLNESQRQQIDGLILQNQTLKQSLSDSQVGERLNDALLQKEQSEHQRYQKENREIRAELSDLTHRCALADQHSKETATQRQLTEQALEEQRCENRTLRENNARLEGELAARRSPHHQNNQEKN